MDIKFADFVHIIVALIGLVGVIYSKRVAASNDAQGNAATSEKRASRARPAKQKSSNRTPAIIAWFSIVLLLGNFGVLGWRILSRDAGADLKIVSPAGGDSVGLPEVVRGTSRRIPQEQSIWLVVYSHAVNRYYPQNDPADVQQNGNWASICYLGLDQDAGKKFDIIATLSNSAVRKEFRSYLDTAKEKQSWPGLERLPESTVIYDRVTVVRK